MQYTVTMSGMLSMDKDPKVELLILEDGKDFCSIKCGYQEAKRRADVILKALNTPEVK
jgi:hypothetical protein